MTFERQHSLTLRQRLDELPTFMIVIVGPRQIGKSTLVRQVLSGRQATFVAADQPLPELIDPFTSPLLNAGVSTQLVPGAQLSAEWLVDQWMQARAKARTLPNGQRYILATKSKKFRREVMAAKLG